MATCEVLLSLSLAGRLDLARNLIRSEPTERRATSGWPLTTKTGVALWTCRPNYGAADGSEPWGFPDLLIAAVAEREAVTLLHYDSDYELIASVTGQAMRWVVTRGTVP